MKPRGVESDRDRCQLRRRGEDATKCIRGEERKGKEGKVRWASERTDGEKKRRMGGQVGEEMTRRIGRDEWGAWVGTGLTRKRREALKGRERGVKVGASGGAVDHALSWPSEGTLDLRGSRREVTGQRSGRGANVELAANAKANADGDGGQRVRPNPESEKSG